MSSNKISDSAPPIVYSERDQICIHIQNREWGRMVPFVDKLIERIDNNTATFGDVLNLLKSSVQYDHTYMPERSAVHKTMSPITNLFKELAVKILLAKTADASDIAGRIRAMFLEAQETLDATVADDTSKMIIVDVPGTLGKKSVHGQTRDIMK